MKSIDGKNYFNEKSFNLAIEHLEKGEAIRIFIDCIGHTRDAMEQRNYREALVKKYGNELVITNIGYTYVYELNRD